MLELRNICFKKDNKKILNNINLILDSDNFIAITGPNGSGKSTLAKIIMGIEKPDSGQVLLDGKDITDLNIDERAKLGIAFAFQTPIRFKGITVYDLLKIAAGNKLTRKQACTVLSKVGLCTKEYLTRELNNSLSGGELKRIEIASIALRNAKVTIFDEPESGIDLWSFNNLIHTFKDIRNTIKGLTIIITHQEKILNIADKIILIKKGKIVSQGEKNDILKTMFTDKSYCGGDYNECHR